MRRLALLIVAAALSLVVPVVGASAVSAAGAGAGASTASMESDFVSRLNSLRASKGLAPLSVDAELTGIARRWAGKMASDGRISHNPNFPNEVSQNWVKLGENVGTGPDVKSVHDAFVASQTHYKNMVDGAFTRIGVGVVIGPNGALYTAHQFMRLASDDAGSGGTVAAPKASTPRAAAPKPAASAPKPAGAAAPRAASAGSSKAAAPAAAAAAAPKPVVVPSRIAMSLEQLQGRSL